MKFMTIVNISKPDFEIEPCEQILFVGSCFADSIGRRFQEEQFQVVVNPYGVMYNPVSIWHTVKRLSIEKQSLPFSTVVFTLGTNHVYIEKATGEIVDNCQKRPQKIFDERELSIQECADYLMRSIDLLRRIQPSVRVILTVSPIRYAKYGYHESQLSKARLLLAAEQVVNKGKRVEGQDLSNVKHFAHIVYFPAYEIVNDELRDYRFYKSDMLHPSEQAVEYIWERFIEIYFSSRAKQFLKDWRPIKEALGHRPFQPESEGYREFINKTKQKISTLSEKYPTFAGNKVQIGM